MFLYYSGAYKIVLCRFISLLFFSILGQLVTFSLLNLLLYETAYVSPLLLFRFSRAKYDRLLIKP